MKIKILVIVLSLLGIAACAFLGLNWLGDYNKSRDVIDALAAAGTDVAEVKNLGRSAYALLLGSVVSLAAIFMVLKTKGKPAAAILLLAGIVPAVFAPKALVFSFLLVLAGGLAFLVRPKTVPSPA